MNQTTPAKAKELHLKDVSGDLSPNTIQARDYQLDYFVDWCDRNGIETMDQVDGRDLSEFKQWRGEDINTVTLRGNLSALRVFLEFCVSIEAAPEGLPDKVNVPKLTNGENIRTNFLDAETASDILSFYEQFYYASLDHVLFLLLWKGGMRMGGLHSIDVEDVNFEENMIRLNSHTDTETRLKNGSDGERLVTFDAVTIAIVEDYIEHKRRDETDSEGRNPLFTSQFGRMSKSALNRHVYSVTAPCQHGKACPAGRDPEDCEHTQRDGDMAACDYNTRPHDIRRGSITYYLTEDVPEKLISDRMNLSMETLERHYDKRTLEERANTRREYFTED